MKPTCVSLAVFLLTLLASSSGRSHGQVASSSASFVIDPDRPYVYLRFDHIGKGMRFFEDEPPKRLWFRFVNNCRVGIVLSTFGPPDGSPDEAGMMHNVVKDPPRVGLINKPNTNDPPNPKNSHHKEAKMPGGYEFDVGSADTIPPGKSMLFSIPINHLGKSWHIEIPFQLEVPSGKGPRPPIVGGEPVMVLFYSIWDLPPDIQKQVLDAP